MLLYHKRWGETTRIRVRRRLSDQESSKKATTRYGCFRIWI